MQLLRLSNIPNVICVIRIMLVVPIVQNLVRAEFELALVLILIAGFSDGLDGFLARRFGWMSRFGGLLDPLADKLLLVSVFGALTWTGLVPVWLFAVVVGRDIVIVSGAFAYEFLIGPVEPKPSNVGKLNTVVALLYLFFVICWQIYQWPPQISITVAGASVFVISLVSGLDYVLTWSRLAYQTRKA
jgi:cardiolipin synthase